MNIEFLVETCFKGRVDKVGVPYIEHCRKVANMAKTIAEKNFPELIDDCYLVGMLHDVMEDCDNGDEIVSRYPKHIYEVVKILTHTKEKTYREYFNDILNSGNMTAIIVKYCDSCHNSDVTRYPIELRDKRIRKIVSTIVNESPFSHEKLYGLDEMQVFLCDNSLEKSAKILDSKRLNKQIVEAFQIVTDRLPNFHHPAYLFWKNYKRELRQYMYCLCNEYSNRFHKEHKCSIVAIPDEIKTFDFIPDIEYNLYTHKVNLLRKNYEWYSQFFHVDDFKDCPEGYYWNVHYGKNSKKQTDCWINYFKLKGI